jgi:ABC-type phosphonate transport system ATPase subunit
MLLHAQEIILAYGTEEGCKRIRVKIRPGALPVKIGIG